MRSSVEPCSKRNPEVVRKKTDLETQRERGDRAVGVHIERSSPAIMPPQSFESEHRVLSPIEGRVVEVKISPALSSIGTAVAGSKAKAGASGVIYIAAEHATGQTGNVVPARADHRSIRESSGDAGYCLERLRFSDDAQGINAVLHTKTLSPFFPQWGALCRRAGA